MNMKENISHQREIGKKGDGSHYAAYHCVDRKRSKDCSSKSKSFHLLH